MSEGFIQILRDPASTPLIQLKTLSKHVNSALEDREKFPNLAESRIKDAKSTAIEILNVYMGRGIVSGADYRKALREIEEKRGMIDKLIRTLEGRDRDINGLRERNDELQGAVGYEALDQIIEDSSGLSESAFDILQSWLKTESLERKIGRKVQIQIALTPKIIEWVKKRRSRIQQARYDITRTKERNQE